MATTEARRSPRRAVGLELTLRRRKGGPITGWTLEVGGGGMRVATDRPLGIDEVLHFDLSLTDGAHVDGDARVLREHAPNVYAMRFEALPEAVAREVSAFAADVA